ncbi:hypothetical protein AnigIFM63604_004555 [Aspergillus niger]|uniref:Fe2OG dioxygenase domain-containing protein n=1 Tax=Aspergillus niger TaxID=5061 RepID=A0A9W5ZWE0_ASPNG|nr:hypothetical protein CBS147346_10581 [Aspergillus niger]GLA29453.1 hypothetical protein AnigIFM63326_007360 [Aspergillus niger]GLA48952.1 hypothetical protein AnigIFM63604_004555 [Aspergillus niger]
MGSLQDGPSLSTTDLPIAPLRTIKYGALQNGDSKEIGRLLEACIHEGFFYLDMTDGEEIPAVLQKVDEMYDFMREWFGQPDEVKQEVLSSNYTDGYKPTGIFAGVRENTRDAYETLKVSHMGIKRGASNPPPYLKVRKGMFESYLEACNQIALRLLICLSPQLGLDKSEALETFHQDKENSNSTLVLLKYPYQEPDLESHQIGHNKHTDIGSITVLFTDQWGLQVLSAADQGQKEEQWKYVEPRRGCAVINVGDSLRFLSQKKLRSCLHRVVPAKGQTVDRYTIAYFLRPSNSATFVDSNGELVTATNWHDRKYEVFKASHADQRKDTVLTGGLEPITI